MSTKRKSRRRMRSQKGALATVMFLIVLQLCFIAAAVSVDVAHQASVRAELQAAVDAGAIAGEEILLAPSSTQALATSAAMTLVAKNYADGQKIANSTKAVVKPVIGTTGGTPSLPTMTVSCSLPVSNLFGTMIGHGTDTLTVSAAAGPGQVSTSYGAFPMTVINRDYKPNTTYTWYVSDAPGLVPGLVNLLTTGLTGYSTGSTMPPYPNTMLGYNTARFLTTFNGAAAGGVVGLVDGVLNGVGGPLGLGSPGTVVGGVTSGTTSGTGSVLGSLLTGAGPSVGADASALAMLSYWSQKDSTNPSSGGFQNVSNTQPSSNYGVYPTISSALAPPALSVGQSVLLTTGANSANNNALDTTAQFLQGATGNRPAGASGDTYMNSIPVTTSGLGTTPQSVLQGSVASWLQNQTVIIAVTNPSPTPSALTVPILNINLLGTTDSTSNTYSSSATGLLGPIVEPLTGVGTATPISAVVNRFIAVNIKSVTVEYQGANGLGLLGLSLLNNPWAQQVVRVTGTVLPYGGAVGRGGSALSGPTAGGSSSSAYAAMLIQ